MAVFALLALSLSIGTLIDVVRRADWQVKTLRRRAWILMVAALPVVGPILWLTVGRPWHPMPLPAQRMHPAMYFALERERAAAELAVEAEADFRRRCRERVAEQRAATRIEQLHLGVPDPEVDGR